MILYGDINPIRHSCLRAFILILPKLIETILEAGVAILSLFLLFKYRREVYRYLKELFK